MLPVHNRSWRRSYFRQGHGQDTFPIASFQAMKRQPLGVGGASGLLRQQWTRPVLPWQGVWLIVTVRQTGQDHVHWIEAIARLVDGFALSQ